MVPDRAREGDAGNAQTEEAQGFQLGKDDEGEREKWEALIKLFPPHFIATYVKNPIKDSDWHESPKRYDDVCTIVQIKNKNDTRRYGK